MAERTEWPCHLRTLHDEHEIEVEDRDAGIMLPTLPPKYPTKTVTCPGVKAHPATMIGKRRSGDGAA